MKKTSSIQIYILLLLVPLFWGGAFVAAAHVVQELSPITAASFRFGMAGIILLFIAILKADLHWKKLRSNWLGLLGMAITGIFGYNAFFFIALNMTSAINGSLVMATSPVFITLGAVLFLGESGNKQLAIGIILSLIGVIVVISEGSLQMLWTLQFNLGDILFLGALVCWVLHGLLGKVVMKDISPLATTAVTTTVGSILLFVVSLSENDWGSLKNMSSQAWVEMLFMIICSTVIAFLLWNYGISKLGASKSSIYMNLVPINTAWLSVVFYGSRITFLQVFGMMMVIVGVYFVTVYPYVQHKKRMLHTE